MEEKHRKRQHFVPNFYFNYFLSENKNLITWDRVENKMYPVNTHNICVENDLYEIKCEKNDNLINEYILDNKIEKFFSEIEETVSCILKRIIRSVRNGYGVIFSKYDRMILIKFIAIQYLRHPKMIKNTLKMYEGVENEKNVKALLDAISEYWDSSKLGSLNNLFEYSKLSGIFEMDLPGSPLYVEYNKISNMKITFLLSEDERFIASSFPLIIDSVDGEEKDLIILPISKDVACVLTSKRSIDIEEGFVKKVNSQFVIETNKEYLNYDVNLARWIIANNEEDILKIKS